MMGADGSAGAAARPRCSIRLGGASATLQVCRLLAFPAKPTSLSNWVAMAMSAARAASSRLGARNNQLSPVGL
eukprot:5688014-Pyramimonas_sp.AAC.1